MRVCLKDQLSRIKSLWHQYNVAEDMVVIHGLWRALDKAIDPDQYKNTEPPNDLRKLGLNRGKR